MAVARSEYKPLRVGIVWITAVTNYQVTVTAVHNHRVETQNATVTSATNYPFLKCATLLGEKPIDDLHLRDKALRVKHEVGLPTVVVDRELSRNTRPL
jgi:hypothetical protein